MTYKLEDAIRFAFEVHKDDRRKYNGTPYVLHCVRVASNVIFHPITREDDKYGRAAVCHDTLEDHPETVDYDILDKVIGVEAAIVVGELTNRYTKEQYPHINRAGRKEMEFERLSACSDGVKVIKMYDRLDNLCEIDPNDGFAILYAKESLALLEAIGDADRELYATCRQVAENLLNGV